MRTGAPDLDDVDDLIAADVDGLLPVAALGGAQVRAVAEALREGVFEPLDALRPRSVVVVCAATGTARAASACVSALLAGRLDVPIVSSPSLPGWIGPLDVVVVVGDDAGDMVLADAAARASRRRAEVVVVAPIEGPLRDALSGNGIDASPRVHVDRRFAFAGNVAALFAVFASLTGVRLTGAMPRLDDVADALDAEAAANHSSRETFHNQAKLLAARIGERPTVWTGDGPAATVIASHNAATLLSVSGMVCGTSDLATVAQTSRQIWANRRPEVDPIFFDPDIDGPAADPPPRVFVATTAAREWYTRQVAAGMPDADVVVGEQASPATPAGGPAGPDDLGDAPTDLASLLVVAERVEMAAVYLALTAGGVR